MAIETLVKEAEERSTYVVRCVFKDEDGTLVVPKSINWSFVKEDETIINNRKEVAVAVPASTINVTLSGLDLQIFDDEYEQEAVVRHFIIEAVYDGSYGSNLPLKDSCKIVIRNLLKIGSSSSSSSSSG